MILQAEPHSLLSEDKKASLLPLLHIHSRVCSPWTRIMLYCHCQLINTIGAAKSHFTTSSTNKFPREEQIRIPFQMNFTSYPEIIYRQLILQCKTVLEIYHLESNFYHMFIQLWQILLNYGTNTGLHIVFVRIYKGCSGWIFVLFKGTEPKGLFVATVMILLFSRPSHPSGNFYSFLETMRVIIHLNSRFC